VNGVIASDDVLALVLARVRGVLGLGPDQVRAGSRLAEDLHADSLDLVEVVEGVERDLLARGVAAAVPDAELLTLASVADVANSVWRSARPAAAAGGGHADLGKDAR
jgi:acyl carrier protein